MATKNARPPTPYAVAVVDIGATAIRLELAEVHGTEIRPLECLQQAVRLGKDTFTRRRIEQETTRECVRILNGYRRRMDEYGIDDPSRIRAVATSSVREAINREMFLDRIYNATGIDVRVIDESEESRLIFSAARSIMERYPPLRRGYTIAVEVGGGGTELVMLHRGGLMHAGTYRLGALRMREQLSALRDAPERLSDALEAQIAQTVELIARELPRDRARYLVALSGDARFAVTHLGCVWEPRGFAVIPLDRLASLAESIAYEPPDRLVARLHMAHQDAETVGPALLAYVALARRFGVKELVVSQATLRDGLLAEFTGGGAWGGAYTRQVYASARALGAKYHYDEPHARQVARLALQLFAALEDEHHLDRRYFLLLRLAALLHDIGTYVNAREHHKHSMYLIQNSDLFGMSRADMRLMAVIARYHRRSLPSRNHREYTSLDRAERIAVAKLAALLRIADALDRAHAQRVRRPRIFKEDQRLVIEVAGVEDLTIERMAVREKGAMLQEYYGLTPVVRAAPPAF